MSFYRKKPVTVEARQFLHSNSADIANWCGGKVYLWDGGDHDERYIFIEIPTLEGNMKSRVGDYIVKGSQFGEFWSVKKEIFETTYEAVASESE